CASLPCRSEPAYSSVAFTIHPGAGWVKVPQISTGDVVTITSWRIDGHVRSNIPLTTWVTTHTFGSPWPISCKNTSSAMSLLYALPMSVLHRLTITLSDDCLHPFPTPLTWT